MRLSPRLVLVLSAIAAVNAKGSKCRHKHQSRISTTTRASEAVSSHAAPEAVSEIASKIVSGPDSRVASQAETIQTQVIVSSVSVVPSQLSEPAESKLRVDAGSNTADSASATTTKAAVSESQPNAALEEPTKKFCGAPNNSEVLFGTPWIVFSMNYNYQSIKGSCCTGYYETTGSGGDQKIHWSSIWDIDPGFDVNVVKGYSFIGLTQGLETRLNQIQSIPSKYEWTVSKTTEYKGNVVYDFMTSDTKGDSTSSNAQELMLWLRYEGGQVPIGWAEGPIATIDGLFGKDGWKLYQGLNTDTGITVSSLLVDEGNQFGDGKSGSFEGDIKDWLVALSKEGVFSGNTYVNVGNAGMEPYWGIVTFDNYLSLRINL